MTSLFNKQLIREIFTLEEVLDEYANDTFISEELAKCSAAPGKLLGCFRAADMSNRVRLISRCIGEAMKMKMDFVQALSADPNDPECPEDAVRILLSSAIDATNVSRGIDDFVDPTEDLRTVFDFGAYRNILNATTGLMTALSGFDDGDIIAKYLMDGCMINIMIIRRALMILNKPVELDEGSFDNIDGLFVQIPFDDYVKVINYDLEMETPPELVIKHDHQVAFNEEEKATIRAREEAMRKAAEEKAKMAQMQKEMQDFQKQLYGTIASLKNLPDFGNVVIHLSVLEEIANTCVTSMAGYENAVALRHFFDDITAEKPELVSKMLVILDNPSEFITFNPVCTKVEDFAKLRQVRNLRFKRHDTMDYVDSGEPGITISDCTIMTGHMV